MGDHPARLAAAWLGHPVTVVALALLLLNDRVLKAAYGTWWTGKLSDVAGLVLAPALVGVVLALVVPRLGTRALVLTSVATVGVGFVVVKATSVGAVAASAAWTALAGRSRVLVDPTDLLALPALALAAWAARRAVQRASSGAPRSAARAAEVVRWGLLLPLALLATVATSEGYVDGPTQIATVDGVLHVGVGGREPEDVHAWHTTRDGVTWEVVGRYEGDLDAVTASVADAGGPTDLACEPGHPRTCYRAGERGLLVERSMDGGITWAVDWSVPDEVVAELADRYSPRHSPIGTYGVAVLETPGGATVYAATGGDGLAVRHPDGTWERIGFPYGGEAAVPLPGERTRYVYAMPGGLVAGAVALWIATLAMGVPRREVSDGASVCGVLMLLAGVVVTAAGIGLDASSAVVAGQSVYFVQVPIVAAALVVGTSLAFGGAVLSGFHVPPATLLAAVGSGVAWQVLDRWPAVATVAAMMVCLLLIPFGRRQALSRRPDCARSGEEGDEALAPDA